LVHASSPATSRRTPAKNHYPDGLHCTEGYASICSASLLEATVADRTTHDIASKMDSRLRKNYFGALELRISARVAQQESTPAG